jgi:hypothetical protein
MIIKQDDRRRNIEKRKVREYTNLIMSRQKIEIWEGI